MCDIPDFFKEAEESLGIIVPTELKNILFANGYTNGSVVAKLDEDAIKDIENFCKNELHQVLDKQDLPLYYGIFSSKPELFKIVGGHQKILDMLQKFFKEKNRGPLSSFRGSHRITKQTTLDTMATMENSTDSVETSTESQSTSQSTFSKVVLEENRAENLTEENKKISKLINVWGQSKLLEKWETFRNDFNNIKIATSFNKNKEIMCSIFCFCNANFKVFKKSNRWIFANFYRHLQNKHFQETTKPTNTLMHSFLLPRQKHQQKQPKIQILQEVSINDVLPSTSSAGVYQQTDIFPSTSVETRSEKLFETRSEDMCNLTINIDSDQDSDFEILKLDNNHQPIKDTTFIDKLPTEEATEKSKNQSQTISNASKWSTLKYQRSERARRAREDHGRDQALITNYIKFIEDVCRTVTEDEVVAQQIISNIEANIDIYSDIYKQDKAYNLTIDEPKKNHEAEINSKEFLSNFLKKLLNNATKNLNRTKNQNVYDEFTKKVALYFFYTGGRLAYETLYANLKNSLPSISTLNRYLTNYRCSIQEGDFDFVGLQKYLKERNLPSYVWISEDATRITGKIEFDENHNKVIGFVLPLRNGIPDKDKYIATSANVIQSFYQTAAKANYAYVVVAQPMQAGSPAFCISVFGSDNKFTYTDVIDRWRFIKERAKDFGIQILGYSSDGDTRFLKAMRINAGLGTSSNNEWNWFHSSYKTEETYIQDTVHILTKLRVRLLKPNIILPLGKYTADVNHLHELINTVGKDKHLLTSSDLKADDKMNFASAEKMCSDRLLSHLKGIPNSEGTLMYLKIMNYILTSFLDCEMSLEARIYRIWYSAFFFRIWKAYIKQSEYTIKDNFISSNCYTCIELNAHSLLKILTDLKQVIVSTPEQSPPYELHMPSIGSQPCEKLFRMTRSMTSTFSTVVNFSIKSFMKRIDRIRTINEIVSDIHQEFCFPREEKKTHLNSKKTAIVTSEEILSINLERCVNSALNDILNDTLILGITADKNDCINLDLKPTNIDNTTYADFQEIEMDEISVHLETLTDDAMAQENTREHMIPPDEEDSLELKDFSNKFTEADITETSPYVRVKLKEKYVIIKKSSFCWLLDESSGRVSTDRLQRFYSSSRTSSRTLPKSRAPPSYDHPSRTKKPRLTKNTKKGLKEIKRKKSENALGTESTSSSEDDMMENYLLDDSSGGEMHLGASSEEENSSGIISEIIMEQYYAVAYEHQWYIGRCIGIENNKYRMKFLKSELDTFAWPKADDIAEVDKTYIFHGPIELLGNGPFKLKRADALCIPKKYKIEHKIMRKSSS